MVNYAVITADVIDSKMAGRIDLQLKPGLERLTAQGLMTPFTLSRGDEIQAVVTDLAELPRILRELRYYCRPHLLRAGIGIGGLDNPRPAANSWEMNGEAFYLARKSLDHLGKEKLPRSCWSTNDYRLDLALNTIFLLVDSVMVHWTDSQWEAVQLYEQNRTYVRAAAVLGIARQNVQKRCYAAKWNEIKLAEENVSQLLLEIRR